MCTSIIEIVRAEGMAKRGDEWFPLSQAVVAYDHARHAPLGDVITLDVGGTSVYRDAVVFGSTMRSTNAPSSAGRIVCSRWGSPWRTPTPSRRKPGRPSRARRGAARSR